MIYEIEIEVDEFQDRQIRKRAAMKEISVEDVLVDYFNIKIKPQVDDLIEDELNDKIAALGKGRSLAYLEALD